MTEPITISTIIRVAKEKVWDCYTLPEHIIRWNFATPDWHCPAAHNNLTPGGTYHARMEAKDGSFAFDFKATYQQIIPYDSFQFVMDDGRKVHFSLEESEAGTIVNIAFDAENVNPLEMQRQGWQAILDNFKNYTESLIF
jgi:uncharacterized protein YndB with AHSA1/START domain